MQENYNNGIDIYNLPKIVIGKKIYTYDIFKVNCLENLKVIFSKQFKESNYINIGTLDQICSNSRLIFRKILTIGKYTIFNERIELRLYNENMEYVGTIY